MIKQFEFTKILGWSVSRYDKFLLCKRQYFYYYYWKFDGETPINKIMQLRQLTSIPLEIGHITHDVIKRLLERLLQTEREIDRTKFFAYTRKETLQNCKQKKFFEIYYNKKDRIDPDELFENIQTNLTNFLNSDRYQWLIKKAVSNKSNWIIEPEGYGETRINKMKAYCKVDFLFPVDNYIYIIDWKTGKSDERKHKKQLLGYGAWTSYHFGKAPDEIIPIIAYLKSSYREIEMQFNESDVNNFSGQIKKETDIMYSFCENIEENIPEDKQKFLKTENKKICNYCNYRELCEQE